METAVRIFMDIPSHRYRRRTHPNGLARPGTNPRQPNPKIASNSKRFDLFKASKFAAVSAAQEFCNKTAPRAAKSRLLY
jgi:hypothetical protein